MKPLIVGVVGGSGSGKTTVARALQDSLGVAVALVDQDAYYRDLGHLTLAERRQVNFDHPDSIDTELFAAHLAELSAGRAIEKPVYDFAAHTRSDRVVTIEPRDVIVVDGILLFADVRLRELFDIRIFVDVADDVRFIRRLVRDLTERGRTVEDVIRQYLETVRPMHLEFVEPSKRHAHVIIPEGGENRVGVDMILAHVHRELGSGRTTGAGAAVSLLALLGYRDSETARWRAWFSTHPAAALDVRLADGDNGSIRGLIRHIFVVELRYGQRLLGLPVSDWSDFRQHDPHDLFGLGDEARALAGRYLAGADEASLGETLTFQTLTAGTVTATRRKLVVNLVNHGVRHWAQIATALRQAGYGDQWPHDLLLSDALP